MTNFLSLTLRLHYAFAQKTFVAPTPRGSFACAKAKRQRQLQSAQSERTSTTRYGDAPTFCKSSHPQKKR
ncbi:hypothetical protein [Lysinibacillus sp. TE18511]